MEGRKARCSFCCGSSWLSPDRWSPSGPLYGLKSVYKIGVWHRCIWRVLATAIFRIAIYTDSYNLYKRNRGEKGTSFFCILFWIRCIFWARHFSSDPSSAMTKTTARGTDCLRNLPPRQNQDIHRFFTPIYTDFKTEERL